MPLPPSPTCRYQPSLYCSMLMSLLLLLSIIAFCGSAVGATSDDGWSRAKRQYYDDGYYGSYYGWQAGRIVGWLVGFFVLMLFICVPCVCCIGIWFLGWFGLRQAMANRRARRRDEVGGRVVAARDQQEISRRYIDASPGAEQRYVYATDRVYAAERRPRSPHAAHGAVNAHEGGSTAYASNGVVTRDVRRL